MADELKKNDFVEIEFTGKVKDGEAFDSNIKEELEKINPNYKPEQAKPFVFALGQEMFLKGVDDFLIGKPAEKKSYTIELSPEDAFGKRDSKSIKLIPMKVFKEHNIRPVPGIPFNFDGKVGKVLSVSGGRVMVDFNHPIAGKDVVYEINLLRKLDDLNEKIKSFMNFIFRKEFPFEIKDKTLLVKAEEGMDKYLELFKDKFKEMFDLDLKVEKEKAEKKGQASERKEKEAPNQKKKEK